MKSSVSTVYVLGFTASPPSRLYVMLYVFILYTAYNVVGSNIGVSKSNASPDTFNDQ